MNNIVRVGSDTRFGESQSRIPWSGEHISNVSSVHTINLPKIRKIGIYKTLVISADCESESALVTVRSSVVLSCYL